MQSLLKRSRNTPVSAVARESATYAPAFSGPCQSRSMATISVAEVRQLYRDIKAGRVLCGPREAQCNTAGALSADLSTGHAPSTAPGAAAAATRAEATFPGSLPDSDRAGRAGTDVNMRQSDSGSRRSLFLYAALSGRLLDLALLIYALLPPFSRHASSSLPSVWRACWASQQRQHVLVRLAHASPTCAAWVVYGRGGRPSNRAGSLRIRELRSSCGALAPPLR